MQLYLGILLFFAGQVFGWFQVNSQLMNEFWKSKPLMSAILFGIPASILFWYAWKFVAAETESAWTARFIGSSTGLIVFPILTWHLLGESMFTAKTMICLFLAVVIMIIQIFY